ncbi:probable cytochrome P450 4d14 [Euwallacea similis]|uniref:probable cytochrome P450 4d14 n=1 Tax=Euwallacea similis TaxID=1736056 RepID=UPI00344DF726
MVLFVVKCVLTLLFSVVMYYVWLIVTKPRVVWFTMSQKGWWIPLLPFLGNAYTAIFTGLKINMLSTLLWAERYVGMPINFWYGSKYHYMSKSADDARIVLNHSKCLNKAELYGDIQYVFKNSILLIPGEIWKGRRRYLRSAFNTNMINTFMPTFNQQSCALIDLINKKKPEDDHYKFFNTHAFMSFFLTSIGWMAEDIKDSDISEFAYYVDKSQDEFVKLLANPAVPGWLWMRSPLGAKLTFNIKHMKRILKNILKKKMAQMAKHKEYVENTTELPLVELLLNEGYECKDRESDVFQEFTLFSAAATDTTGHTLTFIFTLLGMFPDIQQNVYEEVMTVVGDREIDDVLLSKLMYTEAVINEAMRIFPSIPLVGRYCSEDIELTDKILPKGANVFISIFHIQRNPEYWDNPLEFDPSRFLLENSGKIKPGSFLPFSTGPRNCIGQRMATVLVKITVSTVLRHFKISSKHKDIKEFKLTSCISMKTRNHLDLHFTLRNENEQ